jgi:predicted amidohydrolase YtcJ
VLTSNVFATPPISPADLQVMTTVFGGKVVFERR